MSTPGRRLILDILAKSIAKVEAADANDKDIPANMKASVHDVPKSSLKKQRTAKKVVNDDQCLIKSVVTKNTDSELLGEGVLSQNLEVNVEVETSFQFNKQKKKKYLKDPCSALKTLKTDLQYFNKKWAILENTESEDPGEVSKSISSVFDYEDDEFMLEIRSRKNKEAEKVAARKRKKSAVNPSKQKVDLHRHSKKKRNKEESEDVEDNTPTIDELLKPDNHKVLDILDKEIADRKKKHDDEMEKVDISIAREKKRQVDREERMKDNAIARDRLEAELTEQELRRMFRENLEYLKKIETGQVESSRHQAYHKSCRTRQALYYSMITDPFTDNQLEWTLDEIGQVWMKNKKEQMDNDEYVWKVLLAEAFIKFYMDHFGVGKKEAEKRISETPLRKTVEDEDSSDEDV